MSKIVSKMKPKKPFLYGEVLGSDKKSIKTFS
jgi:hypothetical protein